MKLSTDNIIMGINIKEYLTGLLYPRVCPVCGKLLKAVRIDESIASEYDLTEPSGRPETRNGRKQGIRPGGRNERNPYICPQCYAKLDFAEGRSRCMCCSKPLDEETEEYCPDCLKRTRHFRSGLAVMMHNEPARKMLYDLKYGNMRDNADFPALEAARRFGKLVRMWQPDVIIPVPLHRQRLHKRGYNQAALFARKLSLFMALQGYLKIPVDEDYLIRSKKTAPLKELSGRDRAASLEGVFEVTGAPGIYKTVLLVDDIFTTGATVNECAKTLMAAGTKTVFFLTASIGS